MYFVAYRKKIKNIYYMRVSFKVCNLTVTCCNLVEIHMCPRRQYNTDLQQISKGHDVWFNGPSAIITVVTVSIWFAWQPHNRKHILLGVNTDMQGFTGDHR
jgi:hypothetical protein